MDTLAEILRTAKLEQHKNRFKYGELFCLNYYVEVKEKDRTYYEVYTLPRNEKVPEGYKEISFVCLRPDGAYELPSTIGIMCKRARKKVEGLDGFHFHQLRHTFTSNLLSNAFMMALSAENGFFRPFPLGKPRSSALLCPLFPNAPKR